MAMVLRRFSKKTTEYLSVSAFEIILEKGYLGALKYANSIESSDHILASQIDDIVADLYKNATGVNFVKTAQYQIPDYQPYSPPTFQPQSGGNNLVQPSAPGGQPTRQFTPYKTPTDNSNPLLDSMGGAAQNIVPGVAKYQVLSGGLKHLWGIKKLQDFKKILEESKVANDVTQPILTEDAGKILSKVPRAYVQRGGEIVELVDDYILTLMNSQAPNKRDILRKAIDFGFKPPMNIISYLQTGKWTAPLMKLLPGANIHPLIKNWDPNMLLSATQKQLLGQLKNMNPTEALEFLNNNDGMLFSSLRGHISSQSPAALQAVLTEQIGKVNPKGVGTGTGALIQEFFMAVGNKYPFLKSTMSWIGKVGKFLGPLGVAFEGKGLFDHVSKYGWDARAVCLGLSTLLGVASLFPALTPVTGPIWLAVSVGCAVFFPEKAEQAKQDLYKNLTNENIKAQVGNVTFNSLSSKDQVLVTEILNQAKGDPRAIETAVAEAKQGQKFENPLNSLAVIYKEWESNGKIKEQQPEIMP